MADSIDDDWESSSKSSTHSDLPEPSNRGTSDERPDHYRVNVGGDEVAVMSALELVDALKIGRVSAQSLVWKKGMSDWTELGAVPALALLIPSSPKVPSVASAPSNIPSSPPANLASSAPANVPSSPPTNPPPKSSPLSPATPVGARRSALPRNPVPSRVDLSAVRSTSPPVPRPSRPSMASIPHLDIPPLGSVPSNPRPSAPVASRHDDDDDDGVTQVVTTLKMRELQQARGKATNASPPPPPADDKALAVYERPLATLAFAEGVVEHGEANPPARPGSVAPARIISVGPSEPPPAPSRSAPPPSRSGASPPSRPASLPPASRPALAAKAQEGAPPIARPRQPSLPSIVVATAPAVASPPATSLAPDSLEPVTAQGSPDVGAEQEYTHAGKRRRSLVTRNLVLASAGSALFASLVTAVALHRSEPTPLVVAPKPPLTSSTPAQVAASVRAPEPPPKEEPPAVPVLSLSALPKVAPAPKAPRQKAEAPAVVSPPPSFLAEAADGAKPTEKSALDANPYGVELEDDEPAPKAKPPNPAPAWLQEGLKGEDSSSAQNPGF